MHVQYVAICTLKEIYHRFATRSEILACKERSLFIEYRESFNIEICNISLDLIRSHPSGQSFTVRMRGTRVSRKSGRTRRSIPASSASAPRTMTSYETNARWRRRLLLPLSPIPNPWSHVLWQRQACRHPQRRLPCLLWLLTAGRRLPRQRG